MSPSFLVTAAISTLAIAPATWANLPEKRAHFETFAALVLEGGNLPPLEMRAAVAREISDAYELATIALTDAIREWMTAER